MEYELPEVKQERDLAQLETIPIKCGRCGLEVVLYEARCCLPPSRVAERKNKQILQPIPFNATALTGVYRLLSDGTAEEVKETCLQCHWETCSGKARAETRKGKKHDNQI